MATTINVGDTKSRRSDEFRVDPYQLIVHPEDRGRRFPPTPEEIVSLATVIFDEGQLEPVVCRRVEENRLRLCAGFNRNDAVRLIRDGFEGIDGVHRHDPEFLLRVTLSDGNEKHGVVVNIIENHSRFETSIIDDAFNQERLRTRYGYSDQDIAKLYGYKSTAVVSRNKLYLRLDDKTALMVHRRELSAQAALDLLDLPEDQRQPALDAARQTNGKVNGTEVRAVVRDHQLQKSESNGQTGKRKPKSRVRTVKEIKTDMTTMKEVENPHVQAIAAEFSQYLTGRRSLKSLQETILEHVRKN